MIERFKLLPKLLLRCISLTYWKIHLVPIDFWASSIIYFFFNIYKMVLCLKWLSCPILTHHHRIFMIGASPSVLFLAWRVTPHHTAAWCCWENKCSGLIRRGLKSQLYLLLAVCPGESYLTSLGFSFFVSKMKLYITCLTEPWLEFCEIMHSGVYEI